MFYHIGLVLREHLSAFNVIHYISFRALICLLQSLILMVIVGNRCIRKYKALFATAVREDTPSSHKAKGNVPTMGGLLMLFITTLTSLCWCNLRMAHVWLFLFGILSFGGIGFIDDRAKITKKKGITARHKWYLQVTCAGALAIMLVLMGIVSTTITVPFLKHVHPDIGIFFVIWAMLVILAASNAVNLTDGLDGLAAGSLLPNIALYGLLNYAASNGIIASYLHMQPTVNSELPVIAGALLGAVLGFLWFNAYPAQMFMGDCGSLSLGAGLALMALMAKQELLLILSGGIFVLETLSVIIQVGWYKYTKKRIFRMAPIHHHFELEGLPEPKITMRCIIISIVLCLVALIIVKVR